MYKIERILIIILDSVGIGYLPDAKLYGDYRANTLKNLAKKIRHFSLPNLGKLGLGNIASIKGIKPTKKPKGFYGKMREQSKGKDTTSGHWEIAGLVLKKPFNTFPKGFSKKIMNEFFKQTSCKFLGNKPESGTVIINELGDKHVKTGMPIVYTSADSVFQIAAHEKVIPLKELYKICKITRKICDKYNIGRVIARPFIGANGNYKRTTNRKDYSMKPSKPTILDYMKKKGFDVIGIGKIENIFAGSGITKSIPTKSNADGIKKIAKELNKNSSGIIFANLIDFDMLYGHRRDVKGYYKALKEADRNLPRIMNNLKKTDLLIITADHGCDPTFKGTDHTREYVPLLVYHKGIKKGRSLGTRDSFSDIAATIAENFNIKELKIGKSFFYKIPATSN